MSERLAAIQEQTFARSRSSTSVSFPPDTRLTAEQLSTYLDRRAFAVVSTTRPDGRPHAAMTSYIRRDDVFWLPTVADSVRGRNVLAQAWVSLIVAEGDRTEHVMVTIEGLAEIVGADSAPTDVRNEVEGNWVDGWIRLKAQRVLSYGSPGVLSAILSVDT